MRRLVIVSLMAAFTACNSSGSVAPDGPLIQVRLLDDRAASGGRNQVLITPQTGASLDARTGDDGTASIRVPGAGVYRIQVIARAGFVSTAALARTVTVGANSTTVAQFVLYREGLSVGQPPETVGY